MGYYLPPKSYLRPKPRISFKQKVIAITTATLTLIIAGSIFTSLNFESKSANADVTVKKQKIDFKLIIQNYYCAKITFRKLQRLGFCLRL